MKRRNSLAHPLFRFHLLLIGILLFVPTTGFGQAREKQVDSDCAVICTTYLISIQVEVEDESGHLLSDLNKDQFVIYEDGVKQSLEYLKRQELTLAGRSRARYELGYYPTNDKQDRTFRRIQVQVLPDERTKVKGVYWPIGYFAREE